MFRRSRAANSVVGGGIRPKFKIILAFMHILITCKNEDEPLRKNKRLSFNSCKKNMSCVTRKLAFCIGADQLHSKCAADQCLCFRYIVQSLCFQNFQPQSIFCGCTACRTWSETQKTGFLVMWLIISVLHG